MHEAAMAGPAPESNHDDEVYLPSPEVIAAETAAIRAGWSAADYRLRRKGVDMEPPPGGREAEVMARLEMEFTLAKRRKQAAREMTAR